MDKLTVTIDCYNDATSEACNTILLDIDINTKMGNVILIVKYELNTKILFNLEIQGVDCKDKKITHNTLLKDIKTLDILFSTNDYFLVDASLYTN